MKKDIKTNWYRLYLPKDILLFINENPKTPITTMYHKFSMKEVIGLWVNYDLIGYEVDGNTFFIF